MIHSECFTIDISIQNSKPFVETKKKTIYRFKQSRWYSLFYPSIMKADPFLFVHKGRLHLFYEEMPIGNGLGVIKTISTDDLRHWSKPILLTNEPKCHFSYPFVFEDGGIIYMLPETGCDHNIRLYKFTNDELTAIQYEATILSRPSNLWSDIKYDFADSCIYKKDDMYYLFTSYYSNEIYYLELYISDNLFGPYNAHPSSPICTGNKYGRCAGSIIEADGKLYRPTQDCVNSYGAQVHLMEIDELTPKSYKEHLIKNDCLPSDLSLYKNGGHQLNFANFNGQTVIATDCRYYCTFLLEKIRIKLLKVLHLKEDKPY